MVKTCSRDGAMVDCRVGVRGFWLIGQVSEMNNSFFVLSTLVFKLFGCLANDSERANVIILPTRLYGATETIFEMHRRPDWTIANNQLFGDYCWGLYRRLGSLIRMRQLEEALSHTLK